jgi:hypothetical protein
MAYNSTVVDEEIRPDRIYKHMRIEENVLVWYAKSRLRRMIAYDANRKLMLLAFSLSIYSYFSAVELKSLRVAISSFLEMLALATDTIAQFQLSDHL